MRSFLDLATERYSVRAYRPDPVEPEKIRRILDAAKVAPTACNYQPQKIYVVRSVEARAKLDALTPCTFHAPLVFVIGYDSTRDAHGLLAPDYQFGTVDSTIVCAHMVFEAQELGLGTCWVGRFCEEEVKRALNLPEQIRIRHLLPVGYPAENAAPSPRHTEYRPEDETVEYL